MRRLWLCVPPILGSLGDFAVTVRGQPAEYWAGDFDAALEANPLVEFFMHLHPAALPVLALLWIAAYCTAIVKLPRLLARMTSLCVTFGHAFCAGTWLYTDPNGFFLSSAMCVAAGIIYVGAQELSGDEAA